MADGFKKLFIEHSYKRIIAVLKMRVEPTLRSPPTSEFDFIKLTSNHGEYAAKLKVLGLHYAAQDVQAYGRYIGWRWLVLAKEHLEDARVGYRSGRIRTTFSRSYYAAYNASKAVRYTAAGMVSLKGDDHQKASSELPNDFPKLAEWSTTIVQLYENRLLADYDNWTIQNFTFNPEQALERATAFLTAAENYLVKKMIAND